MIQGTYYKEWSSVLNREMEFKVYGSAGVPVLALPARGGRFYDWENNGMPDAIAPLLNEGKVQLFCADSIDGEAVLNGDIPVRRRAEMEEKYFVYLTAELAPRVLALNGAAKDAKLWCVGRSGCLRGRCQSRHAGAGRCAGRTGPARPPRGLGRRCLPRVVLVGHDAGPVCAADSGEVKAI